MRLPSLRRPPIGFAHRGARAHAPENTLEAFKLALRLGATGLESDVWVTADGEAVLDHDGVFGSLLRFKRRSRIADVKRADLPSYIPSLADLYETCGTDFELSLDVKDPAAVQSVLAVANSHGQATVSKLWLCHPDVELLSEWREQDHTVRLVNSTRLDRIKEGAERRAADLTERQIDAMNMHYSDWSGGLATLFHRFGRYAFAWDAQFDRQINEMLRMGVDAIYSDHVDVLMERIEVAAKQRKQPNAE